MSTRILTVYLETEDGQCGTFKFPSTAVHQIQALADTDLFAVSVVVHGSGKGVIDLTPNEDPNRWLLFLTDKKEWLATR